MIALSLGEAEALLRKAARGAGRSWGMAEECGRTIRWLESYGLAAMGLAADLLAQTDGMADTALAPQAPARRDCPRGPKPPIPGARQRHPALD